MSSRTQPERHKNPRPFAAFTGILLAYTWLLGHIRFSLQAPWLIWLTSGQTPQPAPYYPLCVFKNLFHLPCVLCGLTRSFVLIGQGRWIESWRYHLLGPPLYGLAILFILLSITAPTLAARSMRMLGSRPALAAALIVLLLCWIWKLAQDPATW